MKQVPATLGSRSAPTLAIGFSVQAFYFAARAVGAWGDGDNGWALGHVIVAVLGAIGALLTWRHWKSGNTQLQWDGDLCKITDGDRILFSGPIKSIYSVTEDGRGYFLHLDRKQQIRLRRRDVPRELAESLENIIAQQAGSSNGG